MKKIPVLVSGLLVVAVLPTVLPAAADHRPEAPLPVATALAGETPTKEEVVYAHLASDGSIDTVMVVNAFPDAPDSFVDHGNYSAVTNLTTTDPLEVTDGRVAVETDAETFYYQGELAGNDAPWELTITYRLDGSPVSADALLGASGDVEIAIDVRQNPAVDPVFFEHYMLQISVNLDSAYFSQVTSDDATIASNGTTRVVTLASMPGGENTFLIRAVADNAHLGQIQAAGLPFAMAIDLPSPAEYTSDLVALSDAIAQLADGVDQYTDGVGQVADAAGGLGDGAQDLAAGANQVEAGFDRLAAGRGEFNAGLRSYNDGVQQYADGIGQLGGGIESFGQGLDQLAAGSQRLSSGLSTYADGVAAFNTGLGQTADGHDQLTHGLVALADGLGGLTAQGKYADTSLVAGSEQILQALQGLDATLRDPLTPEEAAALRADVAAFSAHLDALEQAVAAVDIEALRVGHDDAVERLTASSGRLAALAAEMSDADAITAQLGIEVADNPEARALLEHLAAQGERVAGESVDLDSIVAGLSALDTQVDALAPRLADVTTQIEAVRGAVATLDPAITAITREQVAELSQRVAMLGGRYQAFHGGLVAYVDGVEQASIGLAGEPGCTAPDPDDPEADPIPAPCYPDLATRYPHLLGNPPGLLSGNLHFGTGLDQLAEAGDGLATGASDLAEGAQQLHGGIVQLQEGAHQFADQAGGIVDGADRLAEGGDQLVDGHGQLLDGDRQFSSGLRDLSSGLDAFRDGTWQLIDGLGTLDASGAELSDGAGTLREETRGMDVQMENQMEEAMADFLPEDFDPVSFTSPENAGITQVQFVYMTDAQIEADEDGGPAEEEAAPKTLWERILDIFR